MSNTSQSQNQQGKNRRLFQCTRCALSFSYQKAYYEHLRSHAPGSGLHLNSASTHKIISNDQKNDISTSDDTARYIAERRKNYPTADNINKKMKCDEERQERGDVLETRQFGKIKERKTISNKNIETEPIVPVITNTVNNNTHAGATLLERLLAPDIRRERNMVLQCIRHIVNNNFFGLDDK